MVAKSLPTRPLRDGTRFHLNNTVGYAQKSLVKALKEGKITFEDADLIELYLRERKHNRNLQTSTQNKIFFSLLAWRKESPPFKDITLTDVYSTLERLTGSDRHDPAYKKNTAHSIYGNVRPFLLWLITEGHNSNLPEKKLLAIKRPPAETMTKRASDMLSAEDIEKLIRACATSRDRALIMMLYEGGFRISEVGNLTWGDLKFDDFGVVVNTNAKTMKPRYVRLTMSREYLAAWKNDYPFSPDADAVIFVTQRKEPITYQSIRKQIGYIAKRAGIQRKITPHLFRHSRITHLIQQGVSESIIKLMMWGSVKTDMFETYAHLTGGDIDRAIFELNGIKGADKDKAEKLEPRQCENCKTICGPLTKYCPACGRGMTEDARKEVLEAALLSDKALSEILENPEKNISRLKRLKSILETLPG